MITPAVLTPTERVAVETYSDMSHRTSSNGYRSRRVCDGFGEYVARKIHGMRDSGEIPRLSRLVFIVVDGSSMMLTASVLRFLDLVPEDYGIVVRGKDVDPKPPNKSEPGDIAIFCDDYYWSGRALTHAQSVANIDHAFWIKANASIRTRAARARPDNVTRLHVMGEIR